MRYAANLPIDGTPAEIAHVLTDVRGLAAWNPALDAIDRAGIAQPGVSYRTTVRGFVPATVTFESIDQAGLDYRIRGAGSAETGTWQWRQISSTTTTVSHTFEHRGLALRLMAPAFEPVARWRLERLADEVRRRSR